jgi:hypothetical protein
LKYRVPVFEKDYLIHLNTKEGEPRGDGHMYMYMGDASLLMGSIN